MGVLLFLRLCQNFWEHTFFGLTHQSNYLILPNLKWLVTILKSQHRLWIIDTGYREKKHSPRKLQLLTDIPESCQGCCKQKVYPIKIEVIVIMNRYHNSRRDSWNFSAYLTFIYYTSNEKSTSLLTSIYRNLTFSVSF